MFLDHDTFRTVVDATPLVSIDLVVENSRGEILLGDRVNRPAKGKWFVPGGRVRKGETLDQAFARLSREELGTTFSRNDSTFLGLYEHHYNDSVFGDAPNTHYVVLAHRLLVRDDQLDLPLAQHEQFKWWRFEPALQSTAVHGYSKAYIQALLGE